MKYLERRVALAGLRQHQALGAGGGGAHKVQDPLHRTHQRSAPSRTHRGGVFASVDLRGIWLLWHVGDVEEVLILLLWGWGAL